MIIYVSSMMLLFINNFIYKDECFIFIRIYALLNLKKCITQCINFVTHPQCCCYRTDNTENNFYKGVAFNDVIWRPSTSKWDKAVYSEPTLLPRKAKKSRYNLKKSSVSSNHGAAEVMRTTGTTITQKKELQKNYFMDKLPFLCGHLPVLKTG